MGPWHVVSGSVAGGAGLGSRRELVAVWYAVGFRDRAERGRLLEKGKPARRLISNAPWEHKSLHSRGNSRLFHRTLAGFRDTFETGDFLSYLNQGDDAAVLINAPPPVNAGLKTRFATSI